MSRAVLLLGALAWSVGCATVRPADPVIRERTVRVDVRTVARPEGVVVDVEQDEAMLSVSAMRPCFRQEVRVFQRTTTTEMVNETPGRTAAVAITGAVAVVVGSVVLADAAAGNVGEDEKDARVFNPVGSAGATGIGAGTIAVGLFAIGGAIYDGVRAGKSEVERETLEADPRVGIDQVPCVDRTPVTSLAVELRRKDAPLLDLGRTGEDGSLLVRLEDRLEPRATLVGDAHGTVVVGGVDGGPVDLEPVRVAHLRREGPKLAAAWAALDRSCDAKGLAGPVCGGLRKFIATYPWSPEAREAETILAAAEAAQRETAAAEEAAAGQRAAAQREAQAQASRHAAANAAADQQRRSAAAACQQKCSAGCKGVAACVNQCVAATCGK